MGRRKRKEKEEEGKNLYDVWLVFFLRDQEFAFAI